MSTDVSNKQHASSQTGDRVEPPAEQLCDGNPVRDERGRFVRSGNPRGRPRKLKLPEPRSLAAALARALDEPMLVRVNGQSKRIPAFQLLATRMVTKAATGDTMDMVRMMRAIVHCGALDIFHDVAEYREAMAAQDSGPVWTPELEERYRLLESVYEDGWESEEESRAGPPRNDDFGAIHDPQP